MSDTPTQPLDARSDDSRDVDPTLIIGDVVSTCGNCGGNASPDDQTHAETFGQGEGCGVRWIYLTTDSRRPGAKEVFQGRRPDLQWRSLRRAERGTSRATEREILQQIRESGPDRDPGPGNTLV